MTDTLERYLDPAFVYDSDQGPHRVRSEADARQYGINCVSLGHLVVSELHSRTLPSDLDCWEWFCDQTNFTDVPGPDAAQRGDIAWFGPAAPRVPLPEFEPLYDATGNMLNWKDSPIKHLAIFTGQAIGGNPWLLHSNPIDGTNALWQLSDFAAQPRYSQLYRIARLRSEPLSALTA